jgi:Vitamin K-dependent gamma-carboxylase
MKYLILYFKKIFAVDLRALALMRIWVGGIILTDLAIRASDLEAHYSNMGVLPLHVLFQHAWNPFFFSFHTLSGLWQVQALLFGLAAVFAFLLLIGYHTRLATVVSWILMVSLQNRNTLISQGGDDLLRMLLFWAMFLPWGNYYSFDAARQPASRLRPQPYVSVATAAYILQICLLYICTALLKNAPEWRTEGTALYYALSLDQVLMPLGKVIYPYPELLRILTHITFYTELFLPLLLFIPVYTSFFRLAFVGILACFHIGISLTLFVGLFYLINFASLAGLLPPMAMDWVDRKILPAFNRVYLRLQGLRSRARLPMPVRLEFKLQAHPRFYPAHLGVVRDTLVGCLLAYVLWWNLDISVFQGRLMPEGSRWLGPLLRIDQFWGMFAPAVFKDDGWYVLEGTTAHQRRVDLNQQGKEPDTLKPASVMSLFKNDRWRKYSENYLFVSNAFMRPYYCNYLLRRWNEDHPDDPVTTLEVVYMKEVSLPDYQVSPPQREVLCVCGTANQ